MESYNKEFLTPEKIKSILSDIWFNRVDKAKMGSHPNESRRVVMMTGKGGLKTFRKQVKTYTLSYHIKVARYNRRKHIH